MTNFLDSKNNFENSNLDDENELDLDVQELLEKNKNIYNILLLNPKP